MAGRRRKWLIASTLLAILAVAAWALLGRGGRMEVQLVFVGYTNKLMRVQPPASETIPISFGSLEIPISFRSLEPIVLATNSGTVAVEIYASVRPASTSIQYPDGFAAPRGPVPSRVLKPGETVLIELGWANYRQPWFTEVYAQRRSLSDRVYCKAWDSGNGTIQGILIRWLPALPEVWAKLGPITNAPPDMEPGLIDIGKQLDRITTPPPDQEDLKSVLDSIRSERQRRPSPSLLDGGTYR